MTTHSASVGNVSTLTHWICRERWDLTLIHPANAHMHNDLLQASSITAELLAGAWASSLVDRHHFDLNLSDLLDKSTQCKRNWLLNVIAARQRCERQQANFEGTQNLSIVNSKLIQQMTTGRASQWSPSTLSFPMPHPLGTAQSPVYRDQRHFVFSQRYHLQSL